MGYRLFLKGKRPVTVETLKDARKILDIPATDEEETAGPDTSLAATSELQDTDGPREPIAEITLTEKDFSDTLPVSNITRVPPGTSSDKKV